MTAEVGQFQRFRIIRPIGEGGMGVVYEAEDTQRGQLVALKTLKHRDLDTLYRLKREFRALAHLSHPNLVDLYDMVVEEETGFLTMELVEGIDIIRHCRPQQPRPPGPDSPSRADTAPTAERVVRPGAAAPCDESRLRTALPQLARALTALHQAGMVHRDIKPPNVLVTHSGRVVVLDFGLVTELDERSDAARAEGRGRAHPADPAGLSLSGSIVGTVEYMAPEQVSDGRVSPAADWYAFGCLLYEALTGRVPHHGAVMQVLIDKQSHPPPPPRALVPGVPPDLDALCVDLLAIDPAQRPTGAEVLRRLGADDPIEERLGSVSSLTQHAAFAGRELELARLAEVARQVSDGAAAVVAVSGPSGIGKSALVRRFLELLRQEAGDNLVVLEGRCYERETVPYKAIDAVVDQLTRYWSQLPPAEAAELLPGNAPLLPRLFPVLGRVPAIAAAPRGPLPADPHQLRYDAFAALRHVLRRLAVKRELVLFLDDLQWGDLDSIRLLADIMRPPDPPALLLLFCSRDQSDPGSWDDVSVEAPIRHAALDSLLSALSPRLTRIELGPLAPPDAIELARRYLRGTSPRMAERVAQEAGGLPLFISELAIHMQLEARGDSHPIGLEDLLRRRVDQLPDNARELLELAAVAGEPISQRVAASALSCSPEVLGRAIRFLRTVHLVQAPGGRATDRVECYHSRIRECVRARLGAARQRDLHRALAVALEQWSEGSSEQLARHWHGAGEALRAGEFARTAADEALRKVDFHRAARFFRMALESRPEGEERRALLVALGGALDHAGRPAEAAHAYREAAELADPVLALELRHRSAAALLRGGYVGRGLEAIEEVLREIGVQAPGGRAAGLGERLRRWRGARTGPWVSEGELPPRALIEMDVCGSMAVALSTLDTARGAVYLARYLALADRHREPRRLGQALALDAAYAAGGGDYRRAERMIARASRAMADSGQAGGRPHLLWARAVLAMSRDGAWRSALDLFRRAVVELGEQNRPTGWEAATSEQHALACRLWLGELGAVADRVPGLVRAAELRGDHHAALGVRLRFGPLLALWLDDPVAADRELESALAAWSGTQRGSASGPVRHTGALLARIDLLLYQDEPARLAEHTRLDARALAGSRFAGYPHVLREVAHGLGRVALAGAAAAQGARRSAALEEVSRLCAILRGGAPPWTAAAQLMAAGAAHLEGRAAEARRLASAAAAGFERLEMRAHAAAARAALGVVLGGAEGAAHVRAARDELAGQGIARPERWVAVLAPGFADTSGLSDRGRH